MKELSVPFKTLLCKLCEMEVRVPETFASAVCGQCVKEEDEKKRLANKISQFESVLRRFTPGSVSHKDFERRLAYAKAALARLNRIAASRTFGKE